MSREDEALARLRAGRCQPGDRDLLPLTLSADLVAAVLGISTRSVYNDAHSESPVVPPLSVGRRLVWRTSQVLDAVGAP